MRRDDFIDYHLVADRHLAIHAELENWARWVRPRAQGWHVSPMFRQYRSHAWQWETPAVRVDPNMPRAVDMEKAVSGLPEKERFAIRWSYVFQGHPSAVARHLGVSKQGLCDLIATGRTMLINRGM
jgi:hypothetical protein